VIGPADQRARAAEPSPGDLQVFPSSAAATAAVAGLVAGWIAAGSVGLLGHAWRRGLVWVALGCVLLAALPRRDRRGRFLLAVLLAAAAALPGIASELRPINVLSVVLVLAAVAQGQEGASHRILRWSAEAVALLALYRVAVTSIPLAWLAADAVGTALGRAAETLTRQPLWIGATFAGLDFLVVMAHVALRAAAPSRPREGIFHHPSPVAQDERARQSSVNLGVGSPADRPAGRRWRRPALAIMAVVLGHMIYLNALSWSPLIRDQMPAASPPATPWNPYPHPPGFEAAVKRWTYGDPDHEGGTAWHEPLVRLVLKGLFAAGQSLRGWIPWNMPLLAAILHAAIAWALFRWMAGRPEGPSGHASTPSPSGSSRRRGWAMAASAALAVVLAAALPCVVALSLHRPSLEGKKIVLFEEGFLNWEKPRYGNTSVSYGQYSIGMYGMLPIFLRSLGAEPVLSPDLSESDLDGADVVVLIFPDKPWKPGQVDRLRRFVDRGGALLVLGEHTILDAELLKLQDEALGTQLALLYEKLKPLTFQRAGAKREAIEALQRQERAWKQPFDEREVAERLAKAASAGPLNRFNEVLEHSDVQVRFDSATFAVGGWLQSYQALTHPTSAGIGDARNAFGVVIGASLDLRWPRAGRWPPSPLLTALWGWGDPGNALNYPSLMAKSDDAPGSDPRYDPGERLGDLVLAAEQRIGKGRVVVFGDTSGFTNGVNIGAHVYTSRIFAYLADPGSSPHEPARQAAGLLMILALAAAWWLARTEWTLALAAVALGASLATCTALTHRAWELLPDGRAGPGKANNLAYIDEAHLGHFSSESWREDGLMGLCLNLMRNDYLVLMLPELKRDRLLADGVDLGIRVESVPAEAARQMKIEPGQGVMIGEVEPGKAADAAGLKPRSIILAVNGQPVASSDAFRLAVEAVPPYENIVFRVLGREAFPVVIANRTPLARLLVSVAPGREFTADERKTIRDFVSAGGVFVSTVGYEEGGPSQRLLEEFGFYVGGRRWKWVDRGERGGLVHYKAGYGAANWDDAFGEPKPLGHFKSPYFNGGDYLAYVRFHAAWPIECEDPQQLVISFYPPDVPVVSLRRYDQGLVVVVGDTAFAQNRNLENRDGSPFEGMRENAVFWRWLLAMLRDGMGEGERWFPQKSDTLPEGRPEAPPDKRP